jgi:hypothetical protein
MGWIRNAATRIREMLPERPTWEQIYLDDVRKFGIEAAEHRNRWTPMPGQFREAAERLSAQLAAEQEALSRLEHTYGLEDRDGEADPEQDADRADAVYRRWVQEGERGNPPASPALDREIDAALEQYPDGPTWAEQAQADEYAAARERGPNMSYPEFEGPGFTEPPVDWPGWHREHTEEEREQYWDPPGAAAGTDSEPWWDGERMASDPERSPGLVADQDAEDAQTGADPRQAAGRPEGVTHTGPETLDITGQAIGRGGPQRQAEAGPSGQPGAPYVVNTGRHGQINVDRTAVGPNAHVSIRGGEVEFGNSPPPTGRPPERGLEPEIG